MTFIQICAKYVSIVMDTKKHKGPRVENQSITSKRLAVKTGCDKSCEQIGNMRSSTLHILLLEATKVHE